MSYRRMFAMNDRTDTKTSTARGIIANGAQTIGRSMTAQNTDMMSTAAMTFTQIGHASRFFTRAPYHKGARLVCD